MFWMQQEEAFCVKLFKQAHTQEQEKEVQGPSSSINQDLGWSLSEYETQHKRYMTTINPHHAPPTSVFWHKVTLKIDPIVRVKMIVI